MRGIKNCCGGCCDAARGFGGNFDRRSRCTFCIAAQPRERANQPAAVALFGGRHGARIGTNTAFVDARERSRRERSRRENRSRKWLGAAPRVEPRGCEAHGVPEQRGERGGRTRPPTRDSLPLLSVEPKELGERVRAAGWIRYRRRRIDQFVAVGGRACGGLGSRNRACRRSPRCRAAAV